MTTRKQFLANEERTNAEVKARATDEDGVAHCERCGFTGYGTYFDGTQEVRGLAISHTEEKGMGGTRHLYTAEEKELLCYRCHNTSPDLHNLTERYV